MGYTVGGISKLTGVTVKALHHYDKVGLLSPSARSEAGYRVYDESDIGRLQRILFYRELGLPLDEIARILADPNIDVTGHLRRQREALVGKIELLGKMVAAIDREMEAEKMDVKLTAEERLELFGDWLPEDYEEEARRRWGSTDAYRQSTRRVSSYTKEDWQKIKAEQDEVEARLAELLESGQSPESEASMDAAEAHRKHISRWYYECGYEIHTGLGEMYVADERFRKNYDSRAEGLSKFVRDSIHANAGRAGRTA